VQPEQINRGGWRVVNRILFALNSEITDLEADIAAMPCVVVG